jgi:iron-sulfur cluster assembly accessory protein
MSIRITDSAKKQILKSFDATNKKQFLRLDILLKENHEFNYLLGVDETEKHDDVVIMTNDIKIVISREKVDITDGLEIDFVMLEDGSFNFIFKNPNDPMFVKPEE